MRKVLILAYDFPPYVSVGGLRPYNWFKYFSDSGMYPIVVTRQWNSTYGNEMDYVAPGASDEVIIEEYPNGTIIRSPYHPNLSNRLLLKYGPNKFKLFRKIISGIFELLQFHLNVGPKIGLYKEAKHYLKEHKVDIILATGDPFVLFRYASKLSAKFHLPWVADYRDPWSKGLHSQRRSLMNIWQGYNEMRFVRKASLITTVDSLFQSKIREIFPNIGIEIIPNGFDPEAMFEANSIPQKSDKLRIALVGTIYEWHPIRHFLETFKIFLNEMGREKVELHFIGTNINEELRSWCLSEDLDIEDAIVISPRMANDKILNQLSSFNVMLLFNYYEFTGTKIYDYIGLNRKILFCFTDDPVSNELKRKYYFSGLKSDFKPQQRIIEEHDAGILVKDGEELLNTLHALAEEFEKNGEITSNTKNIEFFSRKYQTKLLAAHLDRILH
jgi:glycosyltransferase involved in cell wall biosynthesis